MKAIFTALRNRFFTSSLLRSTGRDLLLGFNEDRKNITRPYTEVNLKQTGRFDTFDADVDQWSCEFRFHAKDLKADNTHTWMEEMRRVYKDGNITSGEFFCAGMMLQSEEGPSQTDGSYDAKMIFQLIAQRRLKNPVTRGI